MCILCDMYSATHHGPEECEYWLEGPRGAGASAVAVAVVGEEHAAHVPRRVRLPTHHEHREQQDLSMGDVISVL